MHAPKRKQVTLKQRPTTLWISLYSFKVGETFALPFFAPDDETATNALLSELKRYGVDVVGKLYHVGKFNLANGKFKTLIRKV